MDASSLARLLIDRVRTDGAYKTPEMYSRQMAFVMSGARHLAFVAGIGSGKTYAGCVRALRAAYGMVGDVPVRTPNLGVITAPTYPMLRDATIRTFEEVGDGHIERFNRSAGEMTLKNGSEILWRTADTPDRLRGPSITWWYGDEAAMYRPNVRKIMIGRLRQFGMQGYEWLTTTPRGRNWLYQVFAAEQKSGYELVRASSLDNVYLADDVIADWQREYTGDNARQELMGEFVAYQGLVYDRFSRDVHAVQDVMPVGQRVRVVCGVDWGYANPAALIVVAQDGDGRYCVLDEYVERQRRPEELARVAVELRTRWGVEMFFCDPSSPQNIQLFNNAGLRATGANNAVLDGINRVQGSLVVRPDGLPTLTIWRGAERLLTEFEGYSWVETRDGQSHDAPVKANDHALDALRYAIMGLSTRVMTLKAKAKPYA